MPTNTSIPLQKANDKEKNLSWSEFSTPESFLSWLITRVFVDQGSVAIPEGIIAQDNVPSAADAGKLWIKTTVPYALGFFTDGQYRLWYLYPVKVPMLWLSTNGVLPSGFRAMTNSEVSGLSLNPPTDGSQWVIFEPINPA